MNSVKTRLLNGCADGRYFCVAARMCATRRRLQWWSISAWPDSLSSQRPISAASASRWNCRPHARVAEAVGLVAAVARPCERNGARRRRESVGVPLEHVVWPPLEVPEQAVVVRRLQRVQPVPADLGHVVRSHVAAHRRREQLRAQADSQHRLARGDRLADHRHFRAQVRVLRDLVDVHRPAEHDEPVVAAHVRLGVRLATEVHVADAES